MRAGSVTRWGAALLALTALCACSGNGDGDPAACDPDPCAGETCSGYGSCGQLGCRPYCDCEDGDAVGPDLSCVEQSACVDLGQPCQVAGDCCSNFCFAPGVGDPGYCSLVECADDTRCVNSAGDQSMCCVPGPGFAFCNLIATGYACGDRGGACGDPCVGQLASACQDGLMCLALSLDDPQAHCGSQCGTDADCEDCVDPGNADLDFVCKPFGPGGRFCARP